jgi:hypothetical protein
MVGQEPAAAVRTTLALTVELERIGVTYLVGGSIASSFHGVPRSTNDADVVAAMRDEHVEPLVQALQTRFYVDRDMIRDAVLHRREFNVVELSTMFKIDVFVPPLDLVVRRELERARTIVADPEHNVTMRVASPEDTVAQKLRWYELGAHVSDRQWSDAVGVLVVQHGKLDLVYLRDTAVLLGVSALLERALQEADTGRR